MATALLVLLLIEGILLVLWNRAYWPWGIPVFGRRIAVPTAALLRFPVDRLESEMEAKNWTALRFRPLSERTWAFRESFGIRFGWYWRYPPVMRGLLVIDRQRREIRLVGVCNWWALYVVATLILALAIKPAVVPIGVLVLGASYLLQRHRFIGVEAAVRRLTTQCELPQRSGVG
ncbi:hypothetical protein [Xanthomonas medicagonis]|uniref:hypothetical protein n=1 Tax=Xanthomonas medicagonis TaxID=3160841 RepID=UPI0035190D20